MRGYVNPLKVIHRRKAAAALLRRQRRAQVRVLRSTYGSPSSIYHIFRESSVRDISQRVNA